MYFCAFCVLQILKLAVMAKTSIIIAVSFFVLLLGWLFEVYPWMWWARASDTFPPPVSYGEQVTILCKNLRIMS